MLEKWHLLHVWMPECRQPHYKYCICICPKRLWFLFINGDPPVGRKARELAIEVSNFEVNCLRYDSFIDTTAMQALPDDGRVETALKDNNHFYGHVAPSLRRRIIEAVRAHDALTEEQKAAVLD